MMPHEFPLATLGEAPPLKQDLGDVVMVLDMASLSVNELQDTYLWDWVARELRGIGMRRGVDSLSYKERLALRFLERIGLNLFILEGGVKDLDERGSGQKLVNWILGEACR